MVNYVIKYFYFIIFLSQAWLECLIFIKNKIQQKWEKTMFEGPFKQTEAEGGGGGGWQSPILLSTYKTIY